MLKFIDYFAMLLMSNNFQKGDYKNLKFGNFFVLVETLKMFH